MWSLGCILYCLLCGYPPFFGEDNVETLALVQKGIFNFDPEDWQDVSKSAKDLVKHLICKPEKRLSA
jgi:serine/threonine protein kinase